MSADTTHIRYICPFCKWDGPSPKSVKKHVSRSEDGDHQGVDGFTMERTIETKEDPSQLPMLDRIERAGDEFDEPLSKNDADKVVDAAKASDGKWAQHLSPYMVLRVWKDNGREVDIHGNSSIYFDDLTEKQSEAMRHMYHKDGDLVNISHELGHSKNYCCQLSKKYSYMLEPKFACDELKSSPPEDVNLGGDAEDEESNNNSELIEVSIGNPTLRALEKADVEHEVDIEIKDDEFDAITKLVKAGYEDIAENLFKE